MSSNLSTCNETSRNCLYLIEAGLFHLTQAFYLLLLSYTYGACGLVFRIPYNSIRDLVSDPVSVTRLFARLKDLTFIQNGVQNMTKFFESWGFFKKIRFEKVIHYLFIEVKIRK